MSESLATMEATSSRVISYRRFQFAPGKLDLPDIAEHCGVHVWIVKLQQILSHLSEINSQRRRVRRHVFRRQAGNTAFDLRHHRVVVPSESFRHLLLRQSSIRTQPAQV